MQNLFCIMDVETTGTDPKQHGIVQLSGVITSESFEVLTSFDYPLSPFTDDVIEPTALAVNGIARETIFERQRPIDVHFALTTLLSAHVDKFKRDEKMFFCGYNVQFDAQFVREWFLKCGDRYFGSWFWNPALDVMSLALRRLIGVRSSMPNFKLATVAQQLGCSTEGQAHDAKVDVELTRQILAKVW